MKFLRSFFTWLLAMLSIVGILFTAFSYFTDNQLAVNAIISPLPQLMGNTFSKNAEASAFWQPNTQLPPKTSFNLTAHSVISYDVSENKLIFAKNIDDRLPIASLTKIMTAIIALDTLDQNSIITVSKKAAEIGESTMGLSYGEKLPLKDLLYGLILQSGNDAATAIAQSSPYGIPGYVHLMNKKAEDLGLSNSRFTNPSGLQGDGQQYSTAKELLVMTHYALQNPTFSKIAATYEHDIEPNQDHKAFTLYNETNLLTTYPGVKGVKTGYTDEAGMCLVTYLEYQDHKIIAVILNSENRRQEMKELLDYSLKQLGVVPPPHN